MNNYLELKIPIRQSAKWFVKLRKAMADAKVPVRWQPGGFRLTVALHSFNLLWSCFMRINSRYDEAKNLYQAYSLEQVVEILDKENLDKSNLHQNPTL